MRRWLGGTARVLTTAVANKLARVVWTIRTIPGQAVFGQRWVPRYSPSRHTPEARRTPFGAARGMPPQKLSCCSSLLQRSIAHSQIDAALLTQTSVDVAFFDKADDTGQLRP
jgi:hypothetical protein